MSFEAHITKMDERPVPKLWLAKPDFTIIERINGVSNLSAKMNYMNENEISFDVNSHLFDEFTNEQYRNPTIEKMRNKYLIKMTYNKQTEWFIIENFSKTSDDKDYVPTTAKYIGSELDKKWVGDIEEIGVTPAQLFNKFLPVIAPNWSVRSIDEKVANIKREYTTSDASVSTLIEEVCKATDAVVVFHNRDRQFSLVHRDNAGKFKGLKVKEATYLKGFTDEQNSENLTTRLVLFGKDGLTINGVNPAGTDYIEDFSYYMKPFRRDSRRNVLEHSDYMSDALCHALLDFEEYFNNKTDEYEKLSEQYTNLLKEQLEEEFKLTEITAIKQRLEDRVELLKPQGNYTEKRILGNTSFDFKYNTRYIMVIQNNGTTARLTLNGEEQIVAGGQSTYFKVHTPPQATLDDPQIRHTLQVLSATPNLMASLSTASEDDFAEQDILEIEKKFNIYKYRELYTYQVGILVAVERRIKEYDNQRQSINDSLAVDTFFPPALVKERENFINWGVWREEDHTDAKELLEDGLKQLKEHNNVERTVTVSLIDFIQSLEDKENWDKLSAGDKIQFSNKIYDANMEAFISELNINFDNHDVSVTLSNIIDLKDRNRGIAQKMASFVSTAGKVNMQKSQLEDQLHKSNQVIALLEGEWDANKRRITAANETVSIDNRGIIVTSPSHPNEMLVAVAGVIAISNDGGETFKQAINTRGVLAERLIGKVLIGTELVMENNAGTFRFDNDGVRINASNFHLIADDGEDYFDNLMRRLQQEIVTAEEKIAEEIKLQGESLKSEINDVDQSLMDYTAGLINALADGLLSEQEIHSLKLQLNMLEADYSQVARRVRPILFDSALDPVIQEELYVSYYKLDDDYQTLVSFIRSLEEPTEVPQETINNIITLLKRFKPAIEELVAMIETSLTNTQRNRIANAEYNSNTFAENLANDLNDEVTDLKESLKGLNDSLEDALSDGIITTVEKSQLSDALMRFESEKQDVDNRFHNTYNHAHIAGTTNQVSLQTAKTAYNSAYSTLIAKVKQILNMSSVSHAIVEEYKALYQEFTTAVVAYSEEYERAVEFIQKGYADTAEGEAKKYTDGLRMEVEADVKDIQDNIVEFETDVYGAFKDGIITEQERNRLGIHHDMLEKEKSDLIERYDTIITSDYLQGFYDVEQLVATRSLYGQVHADLLLALELAMMDSKITKEESQEATRLFDLYVQRLTQFSKELELAIAALGESKAVAHTNEQLNNYMSLSVFNDEIALLQAEIDGHIMTWYYDHEPTLSSLPASEWKDDKTRNAHVGDLFYHETEGHAFRFMRKSGGGYEWQLIKDTEVTKALKNAQDALDLADDKRRVFVAQPTPPYDIGDLWIKGDGELMRARVNKEGKTQFSDLDWVKATKYTDDTVANQVGNQLNDYKTTNNREIKDLRETLGAFRDTVEGAFKDGIVAEYELKILKTQMQSLDREKADVDAGYNQLLNHPNLTGAPKTRLQSVYTGFAETHNNLTAAINRVITDGIITEPEYEEVMGLLDSYPIALTTYKNVMNETYLHLIEMAQNVADGALDIAGRLDTWKSSSFEVDVDRIATRVGESSWEEKYLPIVEQDINDAIYGIEVGGRNLILESNNFKSRFGSRSGSIVTFTENIAVKEWKATDATRMRTTGGSTTHKLGSNSANDLPIGVGMTHSIYVRNDGEHDVTFQFNAELGGTNQHKVAPKEITRLVVTGVGRKTYDFVQLHIFSENITDIVDVVVWREKLERGTIVTDWTEAPEDTESRIAQTNKELKDVSDSLSTFEGTINTTFKDGIIETAEAKAIKSHKAQLSAEKKDIDQKYTTIHGNSRLTGTAKTNLASAKTAFNTSHNSLISAIDNAIADGKATTAEYNTVISRFGDYEAKLATLTYRFEEANDYIGSAKATSAETNAKTHADTAAKNAKEAAEAYAKTKAEAERVLAEAHADGKVTAEEKARIADVNARLKEAKSHADTTSQAAEDAAKEYADIEISKIEIGGRNLILDSSNINNRSIAAGITTEKVTDMGYTNVLKINNPDLRSYFTIHRDSYAEYPIANKDFTLSFLVRGIAGENSDKTLTTYYNGSTGYTPMKGDIKEDEYSWVSVTFNTHDNVPNNHIGVSSFKELYFTKMKVETGNIRTDWSPAPEDIENQFKTINSNAYGLNEELTKVFKDGIISEAEATAIGDSINLVKSDYENVMKRYTNVYANTGLVGTAKTNLLSARNAYNTSYNALVNHITAVISSGKITNAQRATYNTLFSDYRVKIGVLSDAIESAWDAIVNKKSGDAADSAVNSFYNTEIKANYSTTAQTKELLGSYVTSTEMQGNLDKISSYHDTYEFDSGVFLREPSGSQFDDAFSYEVTAHTPSLESSLAIVVLNSKGKGKGWDMTTLEEKGVTGRHPRIYFSSGKPAIKSWGDTTKNVVEVVYTKYAGSFTNLSKTSSMIEQKADEINSEVKKKVGNDEIISRINQSAEKISIDANKVNISGNSINIGANPAITGLNTSVGTAQSTANTAKSQADAARVGANIANSINNAPSSVNINADKINLTAGSSLRLAVDGVNSLGNASNLIKRSIVSEGNLKFFVNINGGANVDTSISTLDGHDYFLVRALSSESPSYVSVQLSRYYNPQLKWEKGKNYKLSFKARKSSRTSDFSYTYIMRNDAGANQHIGSPTRITPSEGTNEYLYEFDINPNWDSDQGYLLIGLTGETTGYWMRIRDIMLQEGTVAIPYQPHSSEIVGTNNVISAIEMDSSGVKISGNKISLTGTAEFNSALGSSRGITAISGGRIETDQMTAKRLTIIRDDGIEVTNNGRLKNDFIVASFSPNFMSQPKVEDGNASWDIFYQRGQWWTFHKYENGFDRTEARTFNAYSFNHSAKYLMIEMAVNSPSNGTGLFIEISEFSVPSGVTSFGSVSRGWTKNQANGSYYTFQIDLGKPSFKRRNFYLRAWANSEGTNASIAQFRILRMTQNDDSWY